MPVLIINTIEVIDSGSSCILPVSIDVAENKRFMTPREVLNLLSLELNINAENFFIVNKKRFYEKNGDVFTLSDLDKPIEISVLNQVLSKLFYVCVNKDVYMKTYKFQEVRIDLNIEPEVKNFTKGQDVKVSLAMTLEADQTKINAEYFLSLLAKRLHKDIRHLKFLDTALLDDDGFLKLDQQAIGVRLSLPKKTIDNSGRFLRFTSPVPIEPTNTAIARIKTRSFAGIFKWSDSLVGQQKQTQKPIYIEDVFEDKRKPLLKG